MAFACLLAPLTDSRQTRPCYIDSHKSEVVLVLQQKISNVISPKYWLNLPALWELPIVCFGTYTCKLVSQPIHLFSLRELGFMQTYFVFQKPGLETVAVRSWKVTVLPNYEGLSYTLDTCCLSQEMLISDIQRHHIDTMWAKAFCQQNCPWKEQMQGRASGSEKPTNIFSLIQCTGYIWPVKMEIKLDSEELAVAFTSWLTESHIQHPP